MMPTYLMPPHWAQLSGLCPGLIRIPVDITLHLKKTPQGSTLWLGYHPGLWSAAGTLWVVEVTPTLQTGP